MTIRVRHHLLAKPLELPEPQKYSTAPEALRRAATLYDQLIAKGYSPERAEELAMVARLNGAA